MAYCRNPDSGAKAENMRKPRPSSGRMARWRTRRAGILGRPGPAAAPEAALARRPTTESTELQDNDVYLKENRLLTLQWPSRAASRHGQVRDRGCEPVLSPRRTERKREWSAHITTVAAGPRNPFGNPFGEPGRR